MARLRLELQAVLCTPFSQRHFYSRLLERVPMHKAALSIEQRLISWIRATGLKVPIGGFEGLRQMGIDKTQGDFLPEIQIPLFGIAK